MLKLSLILPIVHFGMFGGVSPRETCGLLRGLVRGWSRAVRLGEKVGWGISLVWSKSEAIDLALDNFPGKCAELQRAVKLVNNLEGAGPPKL